MLSWMRVGKSNLQLLIICRQGARSITIEQEPGQSHISAPLQRTVCMIHAIGTLLMPYCSIAAVHGGLLILRSSKWMPQSGMRSHVHKVREVLPPDNRICLPASALAVFHELGTPQSNRAGK